MENILTDALVNAALAYFIPLALEHSLAEGPAADKIRRVSAYIAQEPVAAKDFLVATLGTIVGVGRRYYKRTRKLE
jgi:hypothetical protein